MPLLGGLFGKAPAGPVRVPVATVIPVAFRIYYQPRYPPLMAEDLRDRAHAWLDAHADDPLRSALHPVIESQDLDYTDMEKTAFPPPVEVLQKGSVGPEERHRLETAYQVTVITCRATPRVPMFGLWAALAAGRSAAMDLGGVMFDSVAVSLAPIAAQEERIAGGGTLRVAEHTGFHSAPAQAHAERWLTAGMAKFGLPEIEVLGPTGPPGHMAAILEALGQHLLDSVLAANHGRPSPIEELELPPDLTLQVMGSPVPVQIAFSPARGLTALPAEIAPNPG